MIGKYVGTVARDDRMHGFLSRIAHDQLGVRTHHPAFRAFRLVGSNEVYAYEEKSSKAHDVDFDPDRRYFGGLVRKLRHRGRIGDWDVDELLWLADRWSERPRMWQDRQVWLHGDATPANFIFGHGLDVGAIDLERMKRGDRMFDVGRVAGELQHAFMSATGDKRRAEPFIGHFLWEYSCHFPDRDSAFASITTRLPFYMGLNLLRIARNDYIGHGYGERLVRQAKELLRAP